MRASSRISMHKVRRHYLVCVLTCRFVLIRLCSDRFHCLRELPATALVCLVLVQHRPSMMTVPHVESRQVWKHGDCLLRLPSGWQYDKLLFRLNWQNWKQQRLEKRESQFIGYVLHIRGLCVAGPRALNSFMQSACV